MALIVKYVRLENTEYADVCRYARCLPAERQEKIKRLRFDRDKLLSLVAGLLIRAEMGDVPLSTGEHGKPYADGSDRFFSVSHSGDCVVIAADDGEIGADIEKLPDRDFMKIAGRCYHPNELNLVQTADDPRRAFTRVWTRKEAYLKQTGVGIATDLRAFDTISGALSERIASFDLEGYVISVCAADSDRIQSINISDIELKDILSDE